MEIPDKFKRCAADIADVCKKHDIGYIKGAFRPKFGEPWTDEFSFEWSEQGHAQKPRGIFLSTVLREVVPPNK
jgi:hypothetical protein